MYPDESPKKKPFSIIDLFTRKKKQRPNNHVVNVVTVESAMSETMKDQNKLDALRALDKSLSEKLFKKRSEVNANRDGKDDGGEITISAKTVVLTVNIIIVLACAGTLIFQVKIKRAYFTHLMVLARMNYVHPRRFIFDYKDIEKCKE